MTAKERTRRDRSLWDKSVNELWNDDRPILSPEESLAAAKKLYRHAMGVSWRGKWAIVSGNRFTWPRDGIFYVNADRRRWGSERGLRDIIHLISHHCHRRLHPSDKPHSIRQLRLERRLSLFALKGRWHEGALAKADKAEIVKPKSDHVAQRYRRMIARRDKWKAELARAERLLDKAEREVRAYERRHQERLAA